MFRDQLSIGDELFSVLCVMSTEIGFMFLKKGEDGQWQ